MLGSSRREVIEKYFIYSQNPWLCLKHSVHPVGMVGVAFPWITTTESEIWGFQILTRQDSNYSLRTDGNFVGRSTASSTKF